MPTYRVCGLLGLSLVTLACAGPSAAPLAPSAATHPSTDARGGASAQSEDNEPPAAVFRTTPRADGTGFILGSLPLEVTFNTCPSTDVDAGDRLKTTYDFDGDGTVDLAGPCRATHRFESPASPRVCVTDRQPGNAVCASYQVGPRDDRELSCLGGPGWDFVVETEKSGWGEVGPGPVAPMGTFERSLRLAGSLKRDGISGINWDGDDFLIVQNPCREPVEITVQLSGASAPGDCDADARSVINLYAWPVSETTLVGTACSETLRGVLGPGQSWWIVISGIWPWPPLTPPDVTYAPDTYLLDVRLGPLN